ncbi:cellulose synthase operon protein C [Pseudoxanthomonas taiwanensis J19]|uniref:Cellulose synthase operon protein C n=1 Tax=Pseudoxanthomonas taiwanensis J19 TaxID=935569 RepID=A0A562D3L8_9GAMM|nr:cellulose synthase operon protein C [Pseudoxanthomonas taiwanensis J19]
MDKLVGSSLYQLLLTRGDTNATRNLIYDTALASGRYQELYNQTDGALTAAERRAAALQALYQDPLPAYVLSRDLGNLPIGDIAAQILGNATLARGLTAEQQAQLQGLARGSSATQTPLAFQDTLYAMVANAASARPVGAQDASGAGVAVAYEHGGLRLDIGSTPLGFRQSQVVGGVAYRGQAGETVSWGVEASRRPLTDSLLSFAGVEDPRTGMQWGGVTATGAKVEATMDNGLLGTYGNFAWHRLEGENVAGNDRQEASVGVYVHALETDNQSLTAGLNLTAMRHDRNLSGFTYGHGGYFSPQSYFDLGFPAHWTGRSASQRLAWQVDASVGVQHFRVDPAPYFPDDPQLQAAAYEAASLAALLGLTPQYIEPVYAGQSKTGVSYNLSAAAEWQLSRQLFLGGRMDLNNARDYQQFGTNLYLRFLLDRYGGSHGPPAQPAGIARTVISSRSWYSWRARMVSGRPAWAANRSRHSRVSCQRFFIGSLRLNTACRHQPSANHCAMRAATRLGCSTMSHTIQSSGWAGFQWKPSARRCSTRPVSSTCWRSGPLSTEVTRRWWRVSTQVQPPGAAPRSAAVMPGRSRRSRSLSPSRTRKASSSFSAEREGASGCSFSRGMPSGQGALSRGSARASSRWSPARKHTCRRGRRGSSFAPSTPALRSAGRSALPKLRARPESGLPASESGCSTQASPTRRPSGNAASSGASRSFGSIPRSSASRRSFCRANTSSRNGRARSSARASAASPVTNST